MTEFLREKENGSCSYSRRQNNREAIFQIAFTSFYKFFKVYFLLKLTLKNEWTEEYTV